MIHAVNSDNFGPALWDLNESASSDGNSHPARHRSPRREPAASRQRSMSPKTSSESVNNKNIALKSSATSSDGQIKEARSMARYGMRSNRARINYADLQSSSSSSAAASTPLPSRRKTKTVKGKETECKIHRPNCIHWDTLDPKIRKQESKKYERSLLSSDEKREIRRKQTEKFRGNKRRAETKRNWERNRIANMTKKQKKEFLIRKAKTMREVRARKREREKINDGDQQENQKNESADRPIKKMKSLSDLSKNEDERSTNRSDKQLSSGP